MKMFEQGFKRDCEKTVAVLRLEMGLAIEQPIDMHGAADFLGIPIHALDSYIGISGHTPDDGEISEIYKSVSAFTYFSGSHRTIVYNDTHPPPRHRSNLAHEIAHALLMHPPERTGLGEEKEKLHEREASWLGGVLMLSQPQAHHIAKIGMKSNLALEHYCLSPQMLQFRLNVTGAARTKSPGRYLVN